MADREPPYDPYIPQGGQGGQGGQPGNQRTAALQAVSRRDRKDWTGRESVGDTSAKSSGDGIQSVIDVHAMWRLLNRAVDTWSRLCDLHMDPWSLQVFPDGSHSKDHR